VAAQLFHYIASVLPGLTKFGYNRLDLFGTLLRNYI
jgi:hypothetical protein